MKRACGVLAALAAMAGAAARADIAPDPLATGGTTLVPREERVAGQGFGPERAASSDVVDSVRMVAEEVDLWPSPEKNAVTAVFRLKNAGPTDVAMEVGFPDYGETRLEDFVVEVDGQKQAAEVKKDEPKGPKKVFRAWVCWAMRFPAGAERTVKVSYWMKTGRIFRGLYHEALPDDLRAKLWPYQSGYVLRTGAGWAGRIGKAVVRLHYGDAVKKPLVTVLEPKAGWQFDAKANADVLVLEDFEPDASSDIRYAFRLCDAAGEVALLASALKEKRLGPWAQEHLLLLVEKDNVLKLAPAEKTARALEILEWTVPPQGPVVDQKTVSRGAEEVVHKAFQRLLRHYRESKQGEKAAALAACLEKFLKNILDRLENEKGGRGAAGRQYRAVEVERDDVLGFLRQSGKAAK